MTVYLNKIAVQEELDQEWIDLVRKAKRVGLTPNEIRDFLQQENMTGERSHQLNEQLKFG